MIELGSISIQDENSIVDCRNKIRVLGMNLNFGSVEATRLATATSEICWALFQHDHPPRVDVYFDKINDRLGLLMVFHGTAAQFTSKTFEFLFDQFSIIPGNQGIQNIRAFKFFRDPSFIPSGDFIESEKSKIVQLSREQLMEKLKGAMKQAETANEAKSAFLATMSHEIRTPMNAIINMTGLALETKLSRKQQQYLTVVESSAKGLLALINEILDFSKIEAGKLDLEAAPFSLRHLLEELTHAFRGRVLEKHVEFIVHVALDVPEQVIGDTLRLRQVLINLVGNAFKFTDQGEVVLRVNVEERTSGGPFSDDEVLTLRFTVRDSGIGIPKDKQDRLFSAFSQVDSSTSRKYGGTGLGLAICKKLVDLMGGELIVESEEGKGSTFTFAVKFLHSRTAARRQLTMPEGVQEIHALVIEDNPTSQELVQTLFESYGMTSHVVDSGEDGLRALEQSNRKSKTSQPFNLVVLDWLLPGIDGLSTAERIRQQFNDRNLPIIMISAFAGKEEEAQASAAGIDHFLPKPITASSLYDAILQVNGLSGDVDIQRPVVTVADLEFQGVPLLLAEDNEANQFVAEEILTAAGFELDIAANGREAVEQYRKKPYAAILMDVQMPEMDGLEATRYIRKELQGRHFPIIAMTANAMKSEEEACREAGMDDFIPKPVDRTLLFQTLRLWIPSSRKERPINETGPKIESAVPSPDTAQKNSALFNETPMSIPGIDVKGTLHRLGVSQESYLRMLKRFAAGHHQTIGSLQAALEANDREAARRHAHSIAGAAGNLGAKEIYQIGKKLELTLLGVDGDVSPLFEELYSEADRLIDGIQKLFQEPPHSSDSSIEDDKGPAMDDARILKILQTLKENLGAGDLDALSTTITKLSSGMPSGYKSQIETLRNLIDSYDFDEATEIVDQFLEEFKVT